ncbi:hypothetical protein ELH77_19470 [Rhizobium ruizarguesonis]|uniref:hypothetical protein n=1 Tax=Rhizobium ruizarguesonis TaxID=2081791 RepID=UPI0010309A34|nr:hypothetical protein [Rhizobium ruizarguesonis]TAZ20784.1 hypothetical protein ELH77_19470 [Rhizobium ruizarguesonis]
MTSPSPFQFVGVSSAAEVASGNLTLVTTGVTIQTGDLVIACIAYRDTAAFSAPDASWSIIEQQSGGNVSTTASTAIASGVMMVCESWPAIAPSLVFGRTAGDVARGVLMVYRGQKASGSLNVHSSNTPGANTTTPTTTSISTTTEEELIVAMVAGADNVTMGPFVATDPSAATGAVTTDDLGYEQQWLFRHASNTTTGADTSLGVADATKTATGATGAVQCTMSVASRHVMIAASFKSSAQDRSTEQASKASRYDVMEPNDGAVSVTKLSRYDVFMAVGQVSTTKFSRYDILVPGESTVKRRVQNVNYL